MARTNEEHAAKLREKLNAAHDELEALRKRYVAAGTELAAHVEDAKTKFSRAKELVAELEAVAAKLKELKKLKL